MGVMVSEVYDAFVEAGASKDTARRAAESIPVGEQLATKADLDTAIARLETRIVSVEAKVWKAGITIAGLAVLLNKFLDWAIK